METLDLLIRIRLELEPVIRPAIQETDGAARVVEVQAALAPQVDEALMCHWPGCGRAFGSLNALRIHQGRQGHRTPGRQKR